MKSLKISLTVVALFGALILSAFTTKHSTSNKNARFVDVWFEYVGLQTSVERAKTVNYIKFVPQPGNIKVTCPDADVLCAIKAPESNNRPSFFITFRY